LIVKNLILDWNKKATDIYSLEVKNKSFHSTFYLAEKSPVKNSISVIFSNYLFKFLNAIFLEITTEFTVLQQVFKK
jgi:hypothetical protein